ncbi:PREDICTED: uncharacterized protein LOC102024556 [Chinchilla lanigera]|uniref:uncharacterized protein LOC102024556 n=1 Tax=Chinchilla lanigera TaxID=34839 RepID=UPI000698924F|nr:PREDICTED: uncharacterized protein LOC102024556 [Chinchilla lanigera]
MSFQDRNHAIKWNAIQQEKLGGKAAWLMEPDRPSELDSSMYDWLCGAQVFKLRHQFPRSPACRLWDFSASVILQANISHSHCAYALRNPMACDRVAFILGGSKNGGLARCAPLEGAGGRTAERLGRESGAGAAGLAALGGGVSRPGPLRSCANRTLKGCPGPDGWAGRRWCLAGSWRGAYLAVLRWARRGSRRGGIHCTVSPRVSESPTAGLRLAFPSAWSLVWSSL